jgi:hypothetical protein
MEDVNHQFFKFSSVSGVVHMWTLGLFCLFHVEKQSPVVIMFFSFLLI